MAEYRLSPAAQRDLVSIWNHTTRHWGIEQANRYIDYLAAAFGELAASPKIAPTCEHIRPGYRRWSIEQHLIYFRVTRYGIAVIRVLHNRMDASHHL